MSAWHMPVFFLEVGCYPKIVKALGQVSLAASILSAELSFEYSLIAW